MDKKSDTRLYGVLGFPARHSLSPLMHNAAFRALKIDAEYRIFKKSPEELEGFLHSVLEQNIHGLNITVPYKEKVIPFLSRLSAEGKLIGAVNTVKVSGNKMEGFNTDGAGLLRHLTEDLRFSPAGKVISIIGAGGASKSVSVYLAKEKAKKISLYDVDEVKLSALTNHLKNNFGNTEFIQAGSIEGLDIPEADLLINATPIGMKETDPCLVSDKLIHKKLLVYDLIYNPLETRLLKMAKEKGASVSNGLGMLLYQGALSFRYFTGRAAPLEVMRRALNQGVKNI